MAIGSSIPCGSHRLYSIEADLASKSTRLKATIVRPTNSLLRHLICIWAAFNCHVGVRIGPPP